MLKNRLLYFHFNCRKDGMNISLFQRLCQATNESVAELRLQYRMHRFILQYKNINFVYEKLP